ncbi:MobC family plasmid mobilization relaxosome protein [Streptomyces ipomoeae]|uniref:MobC family plasmid mobilization relaxosome protein n=1 Tax=Streptomyces ipomoeae TaxID=103232 RepID=UPI0029B172E3|nr:MobC family plasmid mobilization relaxosome protein [Streptomyces ipomoeae]MDX2819919.1 MobC family plasmid mobilization relaxosome protein [Streptomyces ipomoeae]MDX2872636.1 MobC family plasmid mobilization relaxosome protein [Streptomyces ipomoeae]
MTNPNDIDNTPDRESKLNSVSGRASYRSRHSSPSGKAPSTGPAPGVAGADQHRGALVREAATEGGSQPEKQPSPRKRRDAKTSRKRSPKPSAHKRAYVCSVRLNDDEKSLLSAAATTARTTLPAFLARSGLAAARDLDKTTAAIAGRRELVAELFAARRHLGHVGNNLNQITRAINAGAHPPELDAVIAATERAIQRVQHATDQLLDQD